MRLQRAAFTLFTIFGLTLLICQPILAAPDVLDTSFGAGGIAKLFFGGTDVDDAAFGVTGNTVAVLADGKYLLAGSYFDGDPSDYDPYAYEVFVARYCPNGQLDDGHNCGSGGFGSNGKTIIPINANGEVIRVLMLVLGDGKILLAGDVSQNQVFLARLNSDGSPDTSFGGGDGLIPDLRVAAGTVTLSMRQLSDGKILITGYSVDAGNNELVLIKCDTDGVLDTSFGTNGVSTGDTFGQASSLPYMAVEDSNHKLIIGGRADDIAFVARYTSAGVLDPTYSAGDGTNGYYLYDPTPGNDVFNALYLLAGDKVLAAGGQGNTEFLLVRLNSDGSLDTDFNTTGIVTTDVSPGRYDLAREIMVQPDGKIIVGGEVDNYYTTPDYTYYTSFGLVRYTDAGQLDTTFGTNGIVSTLVSDSTAGTVRNYGGWGKGILLANGQVVIGGYVGDGSQSNVGVILRYGPSASNVTISGTTGLSGTVLSYVDNGAQSVTADNAGAYTLTVAAPWTGVVTPTLAGYTFAPATRSYIAISTNQISQDFTVASCTPQTTGTLNWSVAFNQCPSGAKKIIPNGLTVVLDSDVSFDGDLEIQSGGTLTPNGKTVSLTGSAAQTLTGNPLTFYNLVISKTNASDTATIVGKLKVSKKLTITKGKLKSASEYGDVEIATEGTLEQLDDAIVHGDWINDGTFIANTYTVTFATSATLNYQSLGGTSVTQFNRWVISPTAQVFISRTPTVTDSVINNGTLSQTLSVGTNSTVNFLQISTNKYQGVDITTDGTTDLGEVSVAIRGNATQCTSDPADVYRNRCFRVNAQYPGTVAMVFYSTLAEDDITSDSVYQYYPNLTMWIDLNTACGATLACTAADPDLLGGNNYFLIGDVNTLPNAVTLNTLEAKAAPDTSAQGWLLALLGTFALGGLRLMRKIARD